MSRGKLQQNMQSKSGNLGGCQSRDNFGDVEIIDLDSGDADVEIIDAPGSSHQGSKFVRKEATSSPNCVISIDDDDDDDESGTDSHAETSGCRYSRPRNRYGLDFTSETESFATGSSGSKDSSGVGFSEGEGSDCEILDDSSGSIRQEWERAHSRKTTPPDKVETTPCGNVEHRSNKSFEDRFNDCFGDCSSSRNKFGLHGDGGACSAPNADSSENPSKEKVSSKGKQYGSFVPGMFQEEIRERVFPCFSFKRCSYRKGKSVFSDNGVRAPEKMVVEEEIAKEPDNGVRAPEKTVEEEIAKEPENGVRSPEEVKENISEEADNCGRSPEKMNVDEENVEEASFGIANRMNDEKVKEKCKPSRDVESSLMQNSAMSSEASKHCEKIGEESALLCVHEGNTEPELDECLLGEREKHKKSDEYRRAAEVEQASRQEQLRIQVGVILGHRFNKLLT